MADSNLRDRLLEVVHAERGEDHGLPTCPLIVDNVLAIVEDEALERMADRLLEKTNLRAMDFRNGMSMELEPARALAANFVGAARAMLGDAPNYSETPVEMEFGLAGQRERFAFIVQRVGKLTPHEARRAAEAERDEAIKERDQAIAHDRRPYPTAWAYEQACKALEAHRVRRDEAEAAIERLRTAIQTIVDDALAHTSDPGDRINAKQLLDTVNAAVGDVTTARPPELTFVELRFLSDLVGGTGNHVWGGLAADYALDGQAVEAIWRKLCALTDAEQQPEPAATPREGCADHTPTPGPDCEASTS